MCTCMYFHGGQKRESDSWSWSFRQDYSPHTRDLGTELHYSKRREGILNHLAGSLNLQIYISYYVTDIQTRTWQVAIFC